MHATVLDQSMALRGALGKVLQFWCAVVGHFHLQTVCLLGLYASSLSGCAADTLWQ